jgi:diadenylate cyclase
VDTFVDYFNRVWHYQWWVVAVELFLIGLVVWWVVDFLEGTRGERLFRGVIFILVAGVLILNLVVERLPFDRLQYLYKGFLIAILIVAVAGFQPEIRRVLIQIGQPRIWTSSSHQISRTVEELVTAVTELSAARIGAIIVIERQVALGEFIETGARLDARVTADLLKTIFYPGTPLHDMAVVIRGDRIVAASVQLPLAEVGSISGVELGSRHRAAVGISAGSDAMCLVVSEETGTISVAKEGELLRNVTGSQIRSHLSAAAAPGHVALMERWRRRPAEEVEEDTPYR